MSRLVMRLILGAVAGAVATWAMGRVTTHLYTREHPAVRRREDRARRGRTSYGVAAEKVAALMGRRLTARQRERYGDVLHWGLGMASGACYGALLTLRPGHSLRKALTFGAGLFLVTDELLNVALGLTPGPRAFPWQAHVRGLVGHLAFGLAADATLRAFEVPVAHLGFWGGEAGEA